MPNLNQQFWTADGSSGDRVDGNPYTNCDGEQAYLVYGCAGYLSGTVVLSKFGVWYSDRGDGERSYYITRDEAVHKLLYLCDL